MKEKKKAKRLQDRIKAWQAYGGSKGRHEHRCPGSRKKKA